VRRRSAIAIGCVLASLGVHPAQPLAALGEPVRSASVPALERIAWEHPDLELYLWDVTEDEGRAQLHFALQLKPGPRRGSTRVGYPRYRAGQGWWRDAVTLGVPRRDRNLEASTERSGRAFFAVVVPRNTDEILLPVGQSKLRLVTGDWIDWVRRERPPIAAAVEPERGPPPGRPVRLSASVRWPGEKPFGDGALDAEERGELLVDVANHGERVASGATVLIETVEVTDLDFPTEVPAPDIEPGGVETVPIPIEAGSDIGDGSVRLSVRVTEPYGHDAAPIDVELATRGLDPSELVLIEDFAVDGVELPVPRDSIVTLHLRVRNVGTGIAEDAVAEVSPGENVFSAHDSPERFELGSLLPGEFEQITYRGYANQRAERFDLEVCLTDARTRGSPSSSILTLPMEDSFTSVPRIVHVTPDPRPARAPMEPPPPPLTSDVDRHVPLTDAVRTKGIAVVLGVERYAAAPSADYAAADARTAARYFEHALGIPAERIELLTDADVTLARMNRVFDRDGWLARRVEEDSEVFVFFAGHGVAVSEEFDPYLVPHDGDLSYVRQTGLSLDTLVERLASLDAARVTLFLDACFSGLTRNGGALMAGTRRLVVVPVERSPSGVSLFSAAAGSQTAQALDEQGHGLFSYFVFRGLGGAADLDRDGLVTSGELKLYLEEEVPRAALRVDREQHPAIYPDDMSHVLVRLP
jgi:hypothetical protein